MSRAKHLESLNAVQLFPFVAVLLCTMGSLLVLLVSVARSSKDRAATEAVAAQAEARAEATARAAESQEGKEAARRELEKIAKYQAEIDTVRARAADQLRQDQLRLSHLEDHMRRLRDQLDSLKAAAAELNSLEGKHVDDRKQAQQEVERLEKLIAESRKEIEQLRAEAKARARSFAIVPYQGQHGTFRRPIYIECREQEIVIQPEGVVFTIDDFQPPIGPGNPLVAALRAAREHIVHYESNVATGKEAEPYPLIIVRPDGIEAYYYVREAIQSWDSEFGYELVEQDWELKFSAADPQLAMKEQQAAELARNRLRALAAAAPQAFGAYRPGGGGGGAGLRGFAGGGNGGGGSRGFAGSSAAEDDGDYELAEMPAGGGPRLASRPGGGSLPDSLDRGDAGQPVGGSSRIGQPSTASSKSESGNGGSAPSDDRYAEKPPGAATSPGKSSEAATTKSGGRRRPPGAKPQTPEDVERQPDGAPASGSYTAGDDPEQDLDELARAAAAGDEKQPGEYRKKSNARGKNWAIANGRPGTIPIRRSIQIVVREDALAILPEASAKNETSAQGHEFRFGDSPDEAYDELIAAVEKRIRDWGMAGEGLSWRPVVELKVSADGDRRVDELMQQLKYSGVEVRDAAVAQHVDGGTGSASR
jgi:hypothetical protein